MLFRSPDEMRELLSNVENYARATKPDSEVKKFIEQGGWKARMGGRGLQNGGNRVVEKIADDKISFSFVSKRQDWLQVCSIVMLAKRHHVLLKFRRRFGMRFYSFQTGATAGLRSGWLLFELYLFIPLMTRILRSWISCRWTRQN